MSVVDILSLCPTDPGDVLFATAERVWTRAELERAVDERAAALSDEHAPGGIVPRVVEADVSGLIELLALWRLGVTPAPLNASLTEMERTAAAHALAAAAVTEGRGAQAILWTSGTAGRPRGVAIPFGALEANARASRERLGLEASDVWLASLSPAHVGGLALLTRALLLGSRLVVMGRFDTERAWHALRSGAPLAAPGLRPTHVSLVPTQLLRVMEVSRGTPPETLRCVLVGGAGIPRELLTRAVSNGWPLALTYGLTEATSQVSTAPPEATRRKPGSVGTPLTGAEVRIAHDGEILVRGATLAAGYVGDDAIPLVDGDGWHHTGDIGRWDADGDLWVIGRRVDRIVTGGVTVDAVEVEEALRSHPAVADACVVGVPDPTWGERVAAWVEPQVDGPHGLGALDRDGLDRHLRERLAPPKLPRHYHVEGGLPRNANGKVDRTRVLDMLRRALEHGTG